MNIFKGVNHPFFWALPKNEGTELGMWILQEARRRHRLNKDRYCKTYLLSYPRSGNHAVRWTVEFLSRRPTLGANDHESSTQPLGLHDLPIFLRGGRKVKSLDPIAVKRHKIASFDEVSKLVFIERDPVEAILSHLNLASEDISHQTLLKEVTHWQELHDYFVNFSPDKRCFIRFEDILNGSSEWINELATFLELDVSNSEITRCSKSLSGAKKTLKRPPKTKSLSTYREKFPNLANFLDSELNSIT